MSDILVPLSPGELLDKITILRIKCARIEDASKLANVRSELSRLEQVRAASLLADELAGPQVTAHDQLADVARHLVTELPSPKARPDVTTVLAHRIRSVTLHR